ncbi:MAG: SLBB domain-containing protein [Bacteroidota bacterium]|nr:SLBB domain-containing protein [Bacteroidota bacterium]
MNYRIIVLSILLLTINQINFSQVEELLSKEKLIELAKSGQLSTLSPSQLRSKIAQLGISESEVIQYAREKNIDLEQYLKQETAAKATIEPPKVTELERQILQTQVAPRPKIVSVPAFRNRPPADSLPPYGFDIFRLAPNTFEPLVNVPTPASYQIGASDEIIVNVWGQTQLTYQLTVTRDGFVIIPNVGIIQVAGLTVQQAQQKLLMQMSQVYEGLRGGGSDANTFLDVSLGRLKTIQVFVMGEVQQPGGYLLSGFSTAFTALYYAGGPNVNGSLRKLQIIRDSKTISEADFYEFALYGKKTGDVRLQDGDVLFLPPAGKRVAIEGSVFRNAIYELKQNDNLANLIIMAGGLSFDAYSKRIHIERIIPFEKRADYGKNVLDIDLDFNTKDELMQNKFILEDGDVISVFSINRERENLVTLRGNVWKQGRYAITNDMTVKDLILKADSLKENTFMERATIVRTRLDDKKKEVLSFNLELALRGDENNNLKLQRLDMVTVYNKDFFKPPQYVVINGAVRNPGRYERTEGMTVADLIITAGGTQIGADLSRIDVARLDTTEEKVISKVIHTSLPEDYWTSERSKDIVLEDFDIVSIRMKPEFKKTKTVIVKGEAKYPGVYAIQYEGERLSNLIKRIGGFKETAYREGIRFFRSTDIGSVDLKNISQTISPMFDTLGKSQTIAMRLAQEDVPIDIVDVLKNPGCQADLILEENDEIIIPRDPGVVYVQGQVQLPSSVPYTKGASLSYYLKQAGGVTENGEKSNTVVVLPNRQKWESSGFFLLPDSEIISGSTIMVPMKMKETTNTLQILREWASISLSTATVGVLIWQVLKK